MYASSRVARCADTSANGIACSVSTVTIFSAASPDTVAVSGPVTATVAPAWASTVIASVRAVVRNCTRSPEADAIRLATLVSAMTCPRPTTTRWSAGVLQFAHQVARDQNGAALGR